jgi:hypothetical protein
MQQISGYYAPRYEGIVEMEAQLLVLLISVLDGKACSTWAPLPHEKVPGKPTSNPPIGQRTRWRPSLIAQDMSEITSAMTTKCLEIGMHLRAERSRGPTRVHPAVSRSNTAQREECLPSPRRWGIWPSVQQLKVALQIVRYLGWRNCGLNFKAFLHVASRSYS